MIRPDDRDDTVRNLLRQPRPEAVEAARAARIRRAVHAAWRDAADRTGVWQRRATIAAAAVLVFSVAAVLITVVRTLPETRLANRADTPAVAAVHIETGPAQRTSLLLPGGGELRVDASSVVTIAEGGEIHLNQGALYLDSKGATLPTVITPAGRITDIGTRFEVRLVSGDTRVRVRDGKVRLAQANAVSDVAAAEELLARADASTTRRRVDPFGADWAWVARAAPRFELDGESLGSFLDWVETEGAWTVAFASPALERSARSTVVHGSIEGMSTTEALEAILPACGLVHRVDLKTGRVTVAAEGR